MPSVDCDPDVARERLIEADITITAGNTEYERWRAERGAATAVAYDETVVVQGSRPDDLLGLLRADSGGRAHVYFDGACRGNPGPAAIGWVLVTSEGIIADGNEQIDEATNNQAEYAALEHAVEMAREYGLDEIDIRGDSQLIIRQVTGEYDTNEPTLRECRVRVRELLQTFDRWSIEHVPRDVNSRADKLANEAFDHG
ncbi:ribonuclease HI [Haloquadratum walsbyi]|jgi:Ribonuclease HI|uniref:Ribonuclease HI n=1 Tax=Haloquadratum walsbyi J07HQW2 TaxID=1238425 RepID=U1N0Q9_9EURY|nr:ribonuclease HI [Haloquadratum walsbyi]ERG96399.1 MAG: ribonuclease HI [Haloquadratum walsbyi J07HQW2]